MASADLHYLEIFDLPRVLDMRTTAQINQGTTAIDGTLLPSHELVDIVQLVLAVREHLLEVFLGDLQSIKALLLLENARSLVVKCRPVGLVHHTSIGFDQYLGETPTPEISIVYVPSGNGHIVEETLRGWGTVGQETPEFTLTGLAESVGTGVPEHVPTLGVLERNQRNCAVALQGTVQIPQFSVDLRNNHIGTHILGHVAQERSWGGLVGLGGYGGGVTVADIEGDVNLGVRAGLGLLQVLLPKLLKELVTLNQPVWENIGSGGLFFGIVWRGSGGFRIALSLGGRPHGQILGSVGSHCKIPRGCREIDRRQEGGDPNLGLWFSASRKNDSFREGRAVNHVTTNCPG